MKTQLADLFWRWSGRLDRGPYAVVGVLLFALKHNIDRAVAIVGFDRPWSLFYYISPSEAARITSLPSEDARFYGTLLAIAIPFIYVGTLMTTKRLRAAKLPARSGPTAGGSRSSSTASSRRGRSAARRWRSC